MPANCSTVRNDTRLAPAIHDWDTGMTTVVFVVVTAVAVALIVVPLVMGARKRQSLPPTKQQYPDPNPSDHDSRDDADG